MKAKKALRSLIYLVSGRKKVKSIELKRLLNRQTKNRKRLFGNGVY